MISEIHTRYGEGSERHGSTRAETPNQSERAFNKSEKGTGMEFNFYSLNRKNISYEQILKLLKTIFCDYNFDYCFCQIIL